MPGNTSGSSPYPQLVIYTDSQLIMSKCFIHQRLKKLDVQRFGLLVQAFLRETGSTLDI